MKAAEVSDWTERLKAGVLDLADVPLLEALELPRVLESVKPHYPVRFLEGQQRNGKQEIGLARERRFSAAVRRPGKTKTPTRQHVAETHTFRHCLLLTSESGRLTTLAVLSRLMVRIKQGEDEPLELVSGSGFSLYRDPDGWKVKPLEEKTVPLSRKVLQARGWHLALQDEAM
jgi:hypothetical protein